ncbi:PD-(D/E)XK nuclease family protein [Thermanaeromonas toyohensis]|uniref:PD-(D/E)XK nuclease family protein n=1 Tax=Thermanaeromonas toyohensis TaxID=161154 RepID=UPI001E4EC5EF|nr:PD-(D/E)XK nuclease family protein [Thermanaeromonas toyohensis]
MYSYTALECFQACPRRFYYRYVERIPEPPSEAVEFGSAVHAAVAAGLSGRDPEEAVRQMPLKVVIGEKLEEAIDLAMRFLRRYSPRGVYLVEEKVKGVIAGEEFVGRLDLVETGDTTGIITITDFKTDWDKYMPTEKMQLPLYAYLFLSMMNEKPRPVQARLWFLRHAREPVAEETLTPEHMSRAVQWAEGIIKEIRDALELPGWMGFDPVPGSWCKTCGYSFNCLDIAEPQDIVEAGALALRLERALDVLKTRLKEHVSEHGPLQVSDQYWGDYSYSIWKFPDIQAFMELLAGAGEDPWDYIEVNGSKLKKLLKGPLGERIRQIGEEKPRHYFTHREKPPGSREEA